MDTIHFVKTDYKDSLRADHVKIQVKSVGMNAKVSHIRHSTFKAEVADWRNVWQDLYVLGAKFDTKDASCSCECAGEVTGIGADVTDLRPGDRVLAMAPGHFATYERFPQWAVCKLQDNEE